jgi:hypothetical protein
MFHFIYEFGDGFQESDDLLLRAGTVDLDHQGLPRLLLEIAAHWLDREVHTLHLVDVHHDLDVTSVKVEELEV